MFMRVGTADARVLAQYVGPHFTEQDLVTLPDRHAIVRLKVNNAPSLPFLLRTTTEQLLEPAAVDQKRTESVIARSRAAHSVAAARVRSEIELRHYSYLLQLSLQRCGLGDALLADLHSRGVRVLGDVVPHLKEDYDKLRALAGTVHAVTILDNLMRIRSIQSQDAAVKV